jgi:DNA-binding MarR family transcriptional regulator
VSEIRIIAVCYYIKIFYIYLYAQAKTKTMVEDNDQLTKDNLFFLTSALARRLTRQADDVFATMGLSSSHALILLLIQKEPEIQPSSLAEKIHLKPSTITRLVQKLEIRQLVTKKSKGRATSIVCTNEGRELASTIEEKWEQLLDEKRDQLGERYVTVLSEMILNAMEKL